MSAIDNIAFILMFYSPKICLKQVYSGKDKKYRMLFRNAPFYRDVVWRCVLLHIYASRGANRLICALCFVRILASVY